MSSTPRIAPIDPPYPADVQASFDVVMRGAPPLLLFRTVARNPRVLARMMAGGLLDRGSISLRSRELMILRTCARCGAEYEWGVHVVSFAERVDLGKEQIHSLTHGDATDTCWTDGRERLLIRAVDALHDHSDIDDALWVELKRHFTDAELLDLIAMCGWYHAISFLARATRLPSERGAPRFTDV